VLFDPELRDVMEAMPPSDLTDLDACRTRTHGLGRQWSARAADGVVIRHELLHRTGPHDDLVVRLYEPPAAAGCVVFLHGGAFVMGDLDLEHPKCLRLAADAGVAVASVGYRLAPEHPFPAALDDATVALRWAQPRWERVGVAGSSAGGCLAASAALQARDEGRPLPAFQLLAYPVLDDRMATPSMRALADTPGWNRVASAQMWQLYLDGAVPTAYAAPGRANDLTGLPPAFVMVAEHDPLHDEGVAYARRLAAAGVRVTLDEVAGVPHGFDLINEHAAVAVAALDRQVQFVRRAIRARP
jgi:acetyl esterase